MTDYTAPLADMRFLLKEVAEFGAVSRLPGCEEATPDLVDAVLEEAGKFAAGVLAPLNSVGDRAGCRLEDGKVITPPGWTEAYQQFAAGGWVGLGLSPDYGGQGLPKCVATPVWEMWFSANTAFTMLPQLNTGESEAILLAASDELKATYLQKLVTGEWGGTMNLTEPQAGSDLAAIRTRAEPQADGSYRISGQKIFISYGDHEITPNIVHLVLARLPDAPPGVKGISMFLVPKFLVNRDGSPGARNDVRCVGLEHKLGIHGSPTCAMSFGDAGGATGWIIGEPNRGLEYMFIMMNEARFGVGVQGIGIGERAYQQALAFARERVQGRDAVTGAVGQSIINHPDVKRMLLTMRARIMAARALAYTAAGWFDLARHSPDTAAADKSKRYVDLLMPVVKGWSTELCQQVCYDAIQVHGGMGFVEETGIAQHTRDARIITIYEGTTGIQANDLVGRKVLRENGATLRELIVEMRGVAAELAAAEGMQSMAVRFAEDIAALERALDWILANGRERLAAVLAGAVPFLHLLGSVCGSWQLARVALAAAKPTAAEAYGADYLRGLIELACFHAHALAVQAPALAAAIVGAGETATAFARDVE
ncbi:acyl-CoA dehydrogenase [Sulfuritalea hydrogenivorans]|uniref:3-methylmercaptopropionyl-CoA dehydrogenase n=1 Tax=Sulfuritalea hydrogenivorans sk43H TaxID=1223802 RepID=W0SCU2_9PROT|nr:acyl-CoA dehydrogenase [Sulfuritalea hydrogenivorans]BAO29034.1 putative acyl-CoA dehydrogenase [Sulfuritalea hydrogenivorans sk43H]